jgi:hypothetical protein
MIHTLGIWLSYQIAGVPVGAWLALAALTEIQDRLRTSRWKSNTILQALINGTIGRLLAKYPAAREPAAPVLATDTAPTEPTRLPSDHGSVSLVLMMIIAALGLFAALAMAGCGSTSDDLRRACATQEQGLSGGYRLAAALYRARVEVAKGNEDVASARKQLSSDTTLYDKTLAVLDGARAEAETQCSAADEVDAGQKKDVKTMISVVIAAGARVAEAIASIEAAFGGGGAK